LPVPQGKGKTKSLRLIRETGQPVFTRTVRAGAKLVMGEVVPGVAVFAVIFADRAPLSLAQVRAPLAPWRALPGLFEAPLLCIHFGLGHLKPPLRSATWLNPGSPGWPERLQGVSPYLAA